MEINYITAYKKQIGQGRQEKQSPVFLQIGKKGQKVQGTITGVADMVTLRFDKTEVNVAKSAVKNPVPGQKRQFQIMDVSSEGIVLKEVGDYASDEIRGRVSTIVDTNGYGFAEQLSQEKVNQAKASARENLAVLQGEDYADIQEGDGSLEEKTAEVVERAIERGKARREWQGKRLEENAAYREEVKEALAQIQATGFLHTKNESQLRKCLEDAGIPATRENMNQVISALCMSQTALEMTEQTKAYLVSRELAPTIDHLYQGKFSVTESKTDRVMTGDFSVYEEQIRQILQDCGKDTPEGQRIAKWLFGQELPIDENTISQVEMLEAIPNKMTPEKVLEQILFAMSNGLSAKEAVLDDSLVVLSKENIKNLYEIEDSTVIRAAALIRQQNTGNTRVWAEDRASLTKNISLHMLVEMQEAASETEEIPEVPVLYEKNMDQTQVAAVTLKRQLEEIRQKMTLQSAILMEQKGIHVETTSINQIVDELRRQENEYYCQQLGESVDEVAPGDFDLLQETLSKTEDISGAHASLLGMGVRGYELLTLNEMHAAIDSPSVNRQEWFGTYETVSTQVRGDLGDSIQKAFGNIPEILRDMGLEATEANQRAVRILGYNSIEITEENLMRVKQLDELVNQTIKDIKPTTVLELIRRGDNPLDMPIRMLHQEIREINEENGEDTGEKYSRFLWRLERQNQITEEERAGYIGLYRLLHQIEQSDGAVIGAVMEANQELTLGNLLTQSRTMKGSGVDARIDDTTGVQKSVQTSMNITEQIDLGFSGEKEYYQNLARESLKEATPEKIFEMSDGELESLLGSSLEAFTEGMRKLPENETLKKEYYQMLAKEVREGLWDAGQSQEYLEKLGVTPTIANVIAMEQNLKKGSVYREINDRKKHWKKESADTLKQMADVFNESWEDQESLDECCEKVESFLQKTLMESAGASDITFEDLQSIRRLGQGIRLQGTLRRSRSYDIPIRTGEDITSINLTIIQGSDESGKIQMSMEDEVYGRVAMEFKVEAGAIKGLVLCESRQGFEELHATNQALTEQLEGAGYQVKNISYGMDFKSRNEMSVEQNSQEAVDTRELYRISKLLVRYCHSMITAKEA